MSTGADVEHLAAHPHLAPVSIIIPGNPVGKGRPRFFRGRAVTPAATRDYEQRIAAAGEEAAAEYGRFENGQALGMQVVARMPIPASWSARKRRQAVEQVIRPTSKPDLDNILKAAADGLNGVLYLDDAQIVETSITKIYHEEPALIITVSVA